MISYLNLSNYGFNLPSLWSSTPESLVTLFQRALPSVPLSEHQALPQLNKMDENPKLAALFARVVGSALAGDKNVDALREEATKEQQSLCPLSSDFFPQVLLDCIEGTLTRALVWDYFNAGKSSAQFFSDAFISAPDRHKRDYQPCRKILEGSRLTLEADVRPNLVAVLDPYLTTVERRLYVDAHYVCHRDRPFWNKYEATLNPETGKTEVLVGVALPGVRCWEMTVEVEKGDRKAVDAKLQPFFHAFFTGKALPEGAVDKSEEMNQGQDEEEAPLLQAKKKEETERILKMYHLGSDPVSRLGRLAGKNPSDTAWFQPLGALVEQDKERVEGFLARVESHAHALQAALKEKRALPDISSCVKELRTFYGTPLFPFLEEALKGLNQVKTVNVFQPAGVDIMRWERAHDYVQLKGEVSDIPITAQFDKDYHRGAYMLDGARGYGSGSLPLERLLEALKKRGLSEKQVERFCQYAEQGSLGDTLFYQHQYFTTHEGMAAGSDPLYQLVDLEGKPGIIAQNPVFKVIDQMGTLSEEPIGYVRVIFSFSDESMESGDIIYQIVDLR